jgi:hypothetical protein
VADSVELSLDVLQRYDVSRLPPADPVKDLDRVRAYCQKNRIDQAILGSGSALPEGGYSFRLVVYDRKKDSITTDQQGASKGALDMFDVTDALVASLLDGLSGTHLLFGSLAVESDPAGATVSVNGKDVGKAPLSLRGLPVGRVDLTARADGREGAKATVTISDGETTHASLSLPRTMGTLAIVMPKDAVATIRSTEIGQKTITGPGTEELPAGDYEVGASSPGLPAASGHVTITKGASTQWLPWSKGYLDVRSDPAGASIVVDGEDVGVAPEVVEVEPGALHTVELEKQSYETFRADLTEDAGSKILISRKLKPAANAVAPAPAAVVPQGKPLPRVSIKIDGKFDDWQNIPPVVVSAQGPTDNKTINKIFLAEDAKNLYIRIDIADKTQSSLLHPDNFKPDVEQFSYAVTMDSTESPKNATVRLVRYSISANLRWGIEAGVRKETFQSPFGQAWNNGSQGDFSMKGSSVEIAVSLDKIRKLLEDLGPTKQYRVRGWTGRTGSIYNGETNELLDLRETDAGYFTF